jgi:hypothetical protein
MGIGPYKGDGEQNTVTLQWLVLSLVLQVLQDHRIKENQGRLEFEPINLDTAIVGDDEKKRKLEGTCEKMTRTMS